MTLTLETDLNMVKVSNKARGRMTRQTTFCQEQELNSASVVSATPRQLRGTVFHLTYMTSLTQLIQKLSGSKVYAFP